MPARWVAPKWHFHLRITLFATLAPPIWTAAILIYCPHWDTWTTDFCYILSIAALSMNYCPSKTMFNVCDFILQYLIVLVNVTGVYLDCFSNRHFVRLIKDSHMMYPTIYVILVNLTY